MISFSVNSDFLKQYQAGMTPNPDILCNKYIKFDKFIKYAIEDLGADALATGHYARTDPDLLGSTAGGQSGIKLLKAVDSWKDQTFFLSQITQDALQKTTFPLGDFTKDVVKKIAENAGLQRIVKRKEVRFFLVAFIGIPVNILLVQIHTVFFQLSQGLDQGASSDMRKKSIAFKLRQYSFEKTGCKILLYSSYSK